MGKCLNILISYAYWNKKLGSYLKQFDEEYPNLIRLFVDSGAFTAFTKNKKITIDEYCEFIDGLPIKPWRYITLDVIGDEQATKDNYLKLLSMGLKPVPVFTHGSDWKDIDFYYDTSDFICYGGLVGQKGSSQVINDINTFMLYAKNRKSHLLGYTSLKWLKRFRPYSCDSSSWLVAQRYGRIGIYLGNGKLATISKKDLVENPTNEVKKMLRSLDLDIDKLKYKDNKIGWHGGDSYSQYITTISWIKMAFDMESNIGTKLFLAIGDVSQLRRIHNGYNHLKNL